MTRRRKWSWWIVGGAGAVVVLLIVAGPILGGVVRGKLVSTVETRTNATLRVGAVTYLPPYGVRVEDAAFVVPDEGGGEVEMVKVKRLELKLAKLPLRPGPLVIERVTIASPVVRLIKTERGLLGIEGLVKPKEKDKEVTRKKLSEVFELRHFAVTDGAVSYEDRTKAGSVPVVWRNLDASTETAPKSAGVYTYDFQGSNGSVGSVRSAGTFDIDNLILDAKSLALKVQVERGAKESAVPAEVQKILNKYQVSGRLTIDGGGTVPLKKLGEAGYRFDVSLDDGEGRVPNYDRPIDKLTARVRVVGRAGEAISTLVAMEAVSGPDVLHVDEGEVAVDVAKKGWELKRFSARVDASAVGVRKFEVPGSAPAKRRELRAGGRFELTAAGTGPLRAANFREFRDKLKFEAVATATDFHMQPPGLAAPVRLVTGAPITINQDVVRVSNLTGRYGEDQFQVTTLRVPLRDLPRVARVEEMSVSATFDRHTAGYPGKVGEWVAKVRPEGPFELGGTVTYDREGSPKLDYHLLAHSDRGAIEYTDQGRKVPVTRIHMDALVERGTARLDYFEANVYGGVVSATGSAKTEGALAWEGKGTVRDFDVRTAVQGLTGKEFDTEKLAGRAFLRFDMAGGRKPESVKGTGNARLVDGKLFEIPVLSDVLGRAGMGRGLVGSEAAATFAIADSKVNIRRMAVGAPAIGVQGHGTVGFDQTLDLDVVIAPLGEWDKTLKRTGVPFLSKALGEVAGAVQGVVNAAASTLLYEFHVTGTGREPRITPVPAPFLSKGGAAIFTAMMGGGGKGTSLEEVVVKGETEEKDGK